MVSKHERTLIMARKLIDISIPLDNDTISDPEPFRPKITYMDHKKTTEQVCSFFPGLKPEDLPDGEVTNAWAPAVRAASRKGSSSGWGKVQWVRER